MPTLLLLSGGLSGYQVVGVVLEERDLLRRFGEAYAAYQCRVPAVVAVAPPRFCRDRYRCHSRTGENERCPFLMCERCFSTRSAP
jgi:hypothetical protein